MLPTTYSTFWRCSCAFMLAGLMTVLSTVMRKMWREQDDADAAASFKP